MKNVSLFYERYFSSIVLFSIILLGCGIWPEMEILVPSFPEMKKAFGVTDGQIQLLMTSNFMGFILGVLIVGPLCDSWGRRFVLVYGSCFYLIMAFVCIWIKDFDLLMAARFFQGFAMTAPMIAGGVVTMELTSGARQIFWMSLGMSTITLCMALAPIAGSWINEFYGYRGKSVGYLYSWDCSHVSVAIYNS